MLGQANFIAILLGAALILAALGVSMAVMTRCYKRCPPNKMLVVFGQGVPDGMKVLLSGAALVWPIVQDHAYLSLEPMKVGVVLDKGLSRDNDRVTISGALVVAISKQPHLARNAAERMLGMDERVMENMVKEIATGNLRLVAAQRTVQEMKSDLEMLENYAIEQAAPELEKLGLEIVSYKIDRVVELA